MANHQYRILGRIPPTSPPTEQENRFIHLYDNSGRILRFEDKEDVFIMVEAEEYRRMIHNSLLWASTGIAYVATIELEVPWSISLPPGKEQLPLSFQHALCIQLCQYFPRCSESPGLDGMKLCDFSRICRPGSDNKDWRERMIARGYDTVIPIFREPRVEVIWEKISIVKSSEDSSMDIQHWRVVMFCANCRAARAVSNCTHLKNASELECVVKRGQRSDFDAQLGRYPPFYTDNILCQDFNYHGLLDL